MLVPRQPAGSQAPWAARAAAGAALGLLAVAVTACGSSSHGSQASGRSATPPSGAPGGPASGRAASSTGLCSSTTSLDSLTVRRTDALPGNHIKFSFPATTSAHDPARVRAVARTLCGLQASHGTAACPADFGVSYRLSFATAGHSFPAVTVNAGGCQVARGLGAPRTAGSAGLWRTLGVAIGIPHPGNAAFRGTAQGTGMSS